MSTIAKVILTILKALGIVGTLTTLFTAMENQPVIKWCNENGSLLLWYIISTAVLYVAINKLKCWLGRTRQELLDIDSYEDQVIQYSFHFNGNLIKGQLVGIWHRTYKERKWLFWTRKVGTGPGRIFAIASVDTFDDGNPHQMTLKHVTYCNNAEQKEATCIEPCSYSEYYMRPYIESNIIDYLRVSKGGSKNETSK